MTTRQARDYLDKELVVGRNIVTFRSLSRALRIHVNDAKNELQCYYDAVRDTAAPAVPVYLVSGEVSALTVSSRTETEDAMDLDIGFGEDWAEADVVYQSKVLLVDARALDEARSQFSRVHSVHIYSLSPSRFQDVGLVCVPTCKVHEADAKGGPGLFSVVGKITGSHVKLRTGVACKNVASSSKRTLDAPAKETLKAASSVKTEQRMIKERSLISNTKQQVPAATPLLKTESKDRLKPSGKLDWSKAKTKGKESAAEKAKGDKKPKLEPKPTVVTNDPPAPKKPGPDPKKLATSKFGSATGGDVQKRGVKRRPRTDTDQESESEPSLAAAKQSTAGGSSLKKGVILSDEDDDSDSRVRMLGKRRQKKSTVASDSEMSLQAMMDIDDEQVDRVPRVTKTRPQREEEEESSGEEATAPPVTTEGEGEESDNVPVIPKKRKPRKVIPVGRNGVRKRRVVKSRTTTDAKGYIQREDYSSYESVEEEEEEEEEEEAETKRKGKGKEVKKASKPKPTARPRGGAAKRGGLLKFFGPDR